MTTNCSMTTPNIGVASGTSLTLTTGQPLILRSGASGTDLSATFGRTATDTTLAVPGTAGHFAANTDMVAGDTVLRNESSGARIYIGALPGSGILAFSVDTAGANLYGSTSCKTSIKAAATASGTLTLPATTGNVVVDSATQTLTGKTIGAGGLAGLTPGHQIFTANGTFTIPTGVTAVKVTVCGGGGAGGGASATQDGGGGGSGSAGVKWLTGLTPGNTLSVTIGGGGTGVSAAAGNNGTGSTVASGTQTITSIVTNGGTGGFIAVSGNGVPGGDGGAAGTGGDMNLQGSAGSLGAALTGGGGGPSIFGGAGRGATGALGSNAGGFCSGGGGAGQNINNVGGNGSGGVAVFEWVN
jgi:hypothetical protein